MKNAIIYILFIVCGCLVIHVWANWGREAPSSPVQAITTPDKQIMSIREMQTFLNAQGHSRYKCKVDGKWGPETAKALDNFICDRNYKESTYANTQLK